MLSLPVVFQSALYTHEPSENATASQVQANEKFGGGGGGGEEGVGKLLFCLPLSLPQDLPSSFIFAIFAIYRDDWS